MPVFEYRGLSEAGKPISGLKEADTPKTLRMVLRKDGVYLTEVIGQTEEAKAVNRVSFASKEIDIRKLANSPRRVPRNAGCPRCEKDNKRRDSDGQKDREGRDEAGDSRQNRWRDTES